MSAPSPFSLLVSHWTLSPSVLVPALAGAAVYLIGARNLGGTWPARRTVSFLAGAACVVVALQSGLDAYDDRLLSIHMWQHTLLLLVAPLLLLGGRPLILALRAAPPQRRSALARVLAGTRRLSAPAPALGVFAAVVILTHLPVFYEATLRHAALHDFEHALYLGAGLLMWSPLLDADPAPARRLDGLGRLIYLILAMMPMALVGAYLNRRATLFYPAYGAPARALGISALDDQGQAGAIMWVVGNVIMVAVGLWTAVAAMVAEERRLVAREARAGSVASPDRGSPA
ncbi:MAG: cytochrome c oxidase assembly protein [Solirubrobacterales bacterium]|nr:cytochrome c oxidase assembly protein [Solirubrobacterales bacterium]